MKSIPFQQLHFNVDLLFNKNYIMVNCEYAIAIKIDIVIELELLSLRKLIKTDEKFY